MVHTPDHDGHETTRNQLDAKRQLPRHVALESGPRPETDTIVDPESESKSSDDHEVVGGGERSTDGL